MISKVLQNKISHEEFIKIAQYLGVAISFKSSPPKPLTNEKQKTFTDIEVFILAATYNLKSSRITEGILCWLMQFGFLLSPSKLRRLIVAGTPYDSAILGAFITLMIEHKIQSTQWRILFPFIHKKKSQTLLIDGPTPRAPNPYFMKFRILAPNFKMEISKFLQAESVVLRNCPELRFRALFGSTVNADIASYLLYNINATPYEIAKETHHHKARVFSVYPKILAANPQVILT